MTWILILIVGLAAGTLGGIVGFGSSIMLMPVLVLTVGPKETVPLMAIAGLMANLSRVAVWWRVVDWAAAAAFSATAVPAAALGARTIVALDPRVVEATLGGFFPLMIPIRRWLLARGLKIGLWHLALVGAGIGFMSGIVATIGPVNTPFFLAYGLVKGAYLSTEALGSAAMGISKAVVFRTFGAMPLETLLHGLIIGASLTAGSWLAKRFVLRMDSSQFRHVMDVLLAVSGLVMLWGALA